MWLKLICATIFTISCVSTFPFYENGQLQNSRCEMYELPWWWQRQFQTVPVPSSYLLDCFARCMNFFPNFCSFPALPRYLLMPRRRIIPPTPEKYILKLYVPEKVERGNVSNVEIVNEDVTEAAPEITQQTETVEKPDIVVTEEDSVNRKEVNSHSNVEDEEQVKGDENQGGKSEENKSKLDLLKANLYQTDIDQSLTNNSI